MGMDIQAPRPHVMAGTFSSIDFRNVIVSRKMSWTLLASLPHGSYESQDLDRQRVVLNLLIQRIVWDTDGTIGFLPVSRFPDTPECPSCNTNKALQNIGRDQLDKIAKWRCKPENDLMKCLEQLAEDFASELLPSGRDRALKILVKAWLNLFPTQRFLDTKRVPLTNARLAQKHDGISFQLTAAKSMHALSPNLTIPQNVFADLCQTKGENTYTHFIPTDYMITDILLVIVFNFPQLVENIPKLEYIYGRHFKHVLYCANSIVDFNKVYASEYPNNPVSFVEIALERGIWGYHCMWAAPQVGYQVSGYLQIGDDVIFNIWNLQTFPRLMPWFQESMRVGHIDWKTVPDLNVNRVWGPWMYEFGHKAVLKAHRSLQSLHATSEAGKKVSSFLQNLHNVTSCDRCVIYEASDIFYLPNSMGADFLFFGTIFSRFKVHLEITIPTILTGLATDAGIYRLRGNYLWFNGRERYKDVYTHSAHFLHPWKFSRLSKPEGASFYCREVIDRIDRDLKNHERNDTSH